MSIKLCPKCTYPTQWRIMTDEQGVKYKVTFCTNKRCEYFYKRKVKSQEVK